MFNVSFSFINGMMLGIEFPTLVGITEEGKEESVFGIQIDLLILRIVLMHM